jgi:hypothetical protein
MILAFLDSSRITHSINDADFSQVSTKVASQASIWINQAKET